MGFFPSISHNKDHKRHLQKAKRVNIQKEIIVDLNDQPIRNFIKTIKINDGWYNKGSQASHKVKRQRIDKNLFLIN